MVNYFNIENRYSGEVQIVAEVANDESEPLSKRLGLAIKWSIANKKDLRGAYLRGANLIDASLRGADLTDAYLRDADLRGADLIDANMRDANLIDADLNKRQLRNYKHDFWAILLKFKDEIPALRDCIINGKINGSVYSGECACLMGTIANIKHCDVDSLEKDYSSYIEQWFLMIKEGDTPENSFASKMALEWIEEFLELSKG